MAIPIKSKTIEPSQCVDSIDLYTVLGVLPTATRLEIRKAYKKLAHKYHPDKSNGTTELFQKIQFAYSVLSNSARRAGYDRDKSSAISEQLYKEASKTLSELFEKIVDEIQIDISKNYDIFEIVKGNIKNTMDQCTKRIKNAEMQLSKFKDINTRITKQDNSESSTIIEDAVERRISHYNTIVSQTKKEHDIGQYMLDILKIYKYTHNVAKQSTSTWSTITTINI